MAETAFTPLTPGQPHPFHLHGFLDDRPERLAVAADEADGDGSVETAEGAANARAAQDLAALGRSLEDVVALPPSPVDRDAVAARAAANHEATGQWYL